MEDALSCTNTLCYDAQSYKWATTNIGTAYSQFVRDEPFGFIQEGLVELTKPLVLSAGEK